MKLLVALAFLCHHAVGHMAVSSPIPLDAAAGDAYRYPATAANVLSNGGVCHGHSAGATYTWIWTPTSSGSCEMYQSCFDTLPESGTLTMSFGAAHDGGPCKLYHCPAGVTAIPDCDRSATGVAPLPGTFAGCTEISSTPDCTLLGSMSFSGAGGGSAVDDTPQLPEGEDDEPVGNDDATATKIRCGTTWADAYSRCAATCTTNNECPEGEYCFAGLTDCTTSTIRCGSDWSDANSKCGEFCTEDADCTIAGEACYADLAELSECAAPDDPSTRPDEEAGDGCVSAVSHISDDWCVAAGCAQVYVDAGYCSNSGASAQSALLTTTTCVLHASFEGETWGDVAIIYDVELQELKDANSDISDEPLVGDTVVEIPGDCTSARQEVLDSAFGLAPSFLVFMLLASF